MSLIGRQINLGSADVYLSEEQTNQIRAITQEHLAKRLKTLISYMADFEFGRGQVLLALIEANFIEYGKKVLTSAAQIISGTDPDVCLSTLRRQIMPEIIASILPRMHVLERTESAGALGFSPDGLWEECLDRSYGLAAEERLGSHLPIEMSAFRAHYTLRLRRERFRNAFRQKLEAALSGVVREAGCGVRQRLSPTITEIRAQARQRRRVQVNSEQQVFADQRLFDGDWTAKLEQICLAFEGRIAVPEAWSARKDVKTWSDVSELIDTDRAMRSRVQKYVRRRLSGIRASASSGHYTKAR